MFYSSVCSRCVIILHWSFTCESLPYTYQSGVVPIPSSLFFLTSPRELSSTANIMSSTSAPAAEAVTDAATAAPPSSVPPKNDNIFVNAFDHIVKVITPVPDGENNTTESTEDTTQKINPVDVVKEKITDAFGKFVDAITPIPEVATTEAGESKAKTTPPENDRIGEKNPFINAFQKILEVITPIPDSDVVTQRGLSGASGTNADGNTTMVDDDAMVEGVGIPKYLNDALTVVTPKQRQLIITLYTQYEQEHLFQKKYFNRKSPPSMRRQLAQQLESLDQEYVDGGLVGCIQNVRTLLKNSQNNVNPLDGWVPTSLEETNRAGKSFTLGTPEYQDMEAKGLPELGAVGFVLVAGGLGERLGYSGIKVGLPTELTSQTTYLQHYIDYILAVQKKYAPPGRRLPLCIMTSADTNLGTIALLRKNNYFGMHRNDITIVQQGQGVIAAVDNHGRMISEFKNTGHWYKVQTKPHGHGDIHHLLYAHGVAKKWKEEKGIKWITMFQDTNGLAFHTLPLTLGVSKELGLIMNSLTVPRKAKQAVGGIVKLQHKETGEFRTINVEYNQLDPLLRASGYPNGDENDGKTGFSPFPGNINQLLFNLESYVTVIERTKGIMPEFVNPKYADESKTTFKKPTRLECMMQDFPIVLNSEESQKVGFTSIAANMCFSPVKNATEDGVQLQKAGLQPGTAATGEADQYAAYRLMMQSIGCNVETAKTERYHDIAIIPGPAVVLKPDFVCCPAELKARFPNPEKIHISARSTLFVRGSGVVIESLTLDGALIIDYKKGEQVIVKDKVITNQGWLRVRDERSSDEVIKMRGYRLDQKEAELMTTDESCTIA